MNMLVLVGFTVILSLISAAPHKFPYDSFKDKIIQRCSEFQKKNSQKDIKNDLALVKAIECKNLWDTYFRPITKKKVCDLKNYDDLFKTINLKEVKDKALFWSGTGDIAHEYANKHKNVYTLEDTFPGYIANGLEWKQLFEVESSPNCNLFDVNAIPYWKKASALFAQKATGTAHVMLNGNNPYHAVNPQSIFLTTELPIIKSNSKLTKLVIFIINEEEKPANENCKTNSVVKMIEDLKASRKTVECFDKPVNEKFKEVVNLICQKKKFSNNCKCVSHKNEFKCTSYRSN